MSSMTKCYAEVYSEPCQTSKLAHFAKIDNDLKVQYCRFKNVPISSSSYENKMLKISH